MVEKPVMTKSEKSNQKKRATTQYQPLPVDTQAVASQKVFDALPIAIVSVDWNGQIQFMNRAAKSLLGEPDPNLKLEQWTNKFGFYLDDGVLPFPEGRLPLLRVLQGENVPEAEEVILRKEGQAKGIWISISAEAIRDENGNVDGVIAIIRDIDYRKQIELSRERQIRRTEALYRFSHSIAEAGNDLNKIMNLVVRFAADLIGDLSLLSLLNTGGEKLRVSAFYDVAPTGQALLRKLFEPEFEYDHTKTLAGSVIRSGEPLLISSIPEEQLKAVTL